MNKEKQAKILGQFPSFSLIATAVLTLILFAWLGCCAYDSYKTIRMVHEQYIGIMELQSVIIHLDEVLTMSARLSAATGDPRWELRYRQNEIKLEEAIKKAARFAPGANSIEQTKAANDKLIVMENETFQLVKDGNLKKAKSVIYSSEYEKQKEIYAQGMRQLIGVIKEDMQNFLQYRRNSAYQVFLAIIVSAPVLFIGWLTVLRAVYTWHAALVQKTLEAAQLNEELDMKVADRTKELEQSRQFLDSIIENIPNMIFVKDAQDLKFVRFNKAGEDLIGFDRKALIGKSDHDFFPKQEADFFVAKDRQVLESGNLLDIPEEPIKTAKKGERILHTKKIPILDKKGQPAYLLGISEDITERKTLENQLLQSGKLAAVGELAGGVAHELNNPLGSILGIIDVLLGEVPQEHQWRKDLEMVKKSAERAKGIVKSLLGFARRHEFTMESIDLHVCLENTLSLCQHQLFVANVEVVKNYSAQPLVVEGSVAQLQQVFLNLIINAMDAMPGGGTLTISTRLKDKKAQILFTDTGSGINPDNLSKIFDPFFTTKEVGKGTGLGLSLSLGIIQKHKGNIEAANSASGKGAVFTVALPGKTQKEAA